MSALLIQTGLAAESLQGLGLGAFRDTWHPGTLTGDARHGTQTIQEGSIAAEGLLQP